MSNKEKFTRLVKETHMVKEEVQRPGGRGFELNGSLPSLGKPLPFLGVPFDDNSAIKGGARANKGANTPGMACGLTFWAAHCIVRIRATESQVDLWLSSDESDIDTLCHSADLFRMEFEAVLSCKRNLILWCRQVPSRPKIPPTFAPNPLPLPHSCISQTSYVPICFASILIAVYLGIFQMHISHCKAKPKIFNNGGLCNFETSVSIGSFRFDPQEFTPRCSRSLNVFL